MNIKLLVAMITASLIGITNADYTAKFYIEDINFVNGEEPEIPDPEDPETPSTGFSITSSLNLNSSKILSLSNQSTEVAHINSNDFISFVSSLMASGCESFNIDFLFPYINNVTEEIDIPPNTSVPMTSTWTSDYYPPCNGSSSLTYRLGTGNNENVTTTIIGTPTNPGSAFSLDNIDIANASFDLTNITNSNFYGYGILKKYFVDAGNNRTLVNAWPDNAGEHRLIQIKSGSTLYYKTLAPMNTPDLNFGGSPPVGSNEIFVLEMYAQSNPYWPMTEYVVSE